jgi:GTPase
LIKRIVADSRKWTPTVRKDRNGRTEMGADGPHKAVSMARVYNPIQGLGDIVGGIIDAGNVKKNNITGFLPILNSKVLDVNMAGARGRAVRIDHFDGSNIIFI